MPLSYEKPNVFGTNHENQTSSSQQKRERTRSENIFHTQILTLRPSLYTVHQSDTSGNNCAINVSFIKDGVEMLNINMLDFVFNYPSKKTKKKKKGLEHEVFLRAFIQNTSQICE